MEARPVEVDTQLLEEVVGTLEESDVAGGGGSNTDDIRRLE